MVKQFSGFTAQQNEVLARKMGYDGPMEQFGKFLQSSPQHQQKFLSYEDKAKKMLAGGAPQQPKPQASFAAGGLIGAETPVNPLQHPLQTLINQNNAGGGTPTPAPTTPTTPPHATDPANPTTGGGTSTTQTTTGYNVTQDLIGGDASVVPKVQVEEMVTSPDEFVSTTSGQATPGADVTTAAGSTPTAQATAEPTTAAPQVDTALSGGAVEAATQGMEAAQGTVSAGSQVTAAQALPSADATVQGQLAKLMQQFEGGETPAWAAGALRNANAIMAQRGLGSSSIAGAAVTQAAMESAIGIAAQDAATFSQFEMQNLNNRQQARLVNAQAFLQMDLANLSNEQQMTMFKSQSIIQSLFTDQAAENASRQFNASSQGQTDQFFANLKTQVSQFNASQTNAMEQFKAGQTDSVNMFNRQMNDATEQFNAQNRLVIDQSNAEWRRAVTTANNATQNEANRTDAMNASNMTLSAYNNLMQRERDFYSFAFTAGENALNRANELAMAKLGASAAAKAAKGEMIGGAMSALGSLGAAWLS